MYECRERKAIMWEWKFYQEGGDTPTDMKKSEKFNSSGYLDLTAYYALKNIEREKAEKQIAKHKQKKRKKKRRESDK